MKRLFAASLMLLAIVCLVSCSKEKNEPGNEHIPEQLYGLWEEKFMLDTRGPDTVWSTSAANSAGGFYIFGRDGKLTYSWGGDTVTGNYTITPVPGDKFELRFRAKEPSLHPEIFAVFGFYAEGDIVFWPTGDFSLSNYVVPRYRKNVVF